VENVVFCTEPHEDVAWKTGLLYEEKKKGLALLSEAVSQEIQIRPTPSNFLPKDELNRPRFPYENNFQLVKWNQRF